MFDDIELVLIDIRIGRDGRNVVIFAILNFLIGYYEHDMTSFRNFYSLCLGCLCNFYSKGGLGTKKYSKTDDHGKTKRCVVFLLIIMRLLPFCLK